MSILIKGLDMPKDDERLCIDIHPDGKVSYNLDLTCKQIATAGSVLPHGRLIEKHDVFELIWAMPKINEALPREFMQALYELPTIIEAEDGET